MVEGILHIIRTGCPWRDVPSEFGPWSSLRTRWRRWCHAGIWARGRAEFASEAAGQWRHLDATYLRVHQDGATPAGGQAGQAMGRTGAGLTTKVTALVDTHGRAVTLALAAGPTADVVAVADVPLPSGKRVVAGKGYDSDAFRAEVRAADSTPCIPLRQGCKSPSRCHRGWYRQRHKVENFFQRMKRFRRVASREEKLDFYFLSVLQLAAIIDWLRF